MLSILIPVYNNDITRLVAELHDQCLHSGIEFEIICLDDGSEESSKQENKKVSKLSHCIWEELPYNVGRASIRNKLGNRAKYQKLLFLDADSAITHDSFISKYLTLCNDHPVIYGGREYKSYTPDDWRFKLHYLYGTYVESKPDQVRNKSPWLHFMSNNFLIEREIFLTTGFENTIKGYGYEDLIFAGKLKEQKIPVFHINNPVLHASLDACEIFLNKTESAIDNLLELNEEFPILYEVKLVKTVRFLQFIKLEYLVFKALALLSGMMKKNILGKNPKMVVFQLYKLYLYIKKGRLHL